jgi:hypothetical protein
MTFTEDLVGQPLSPASFKPQITALYYYTLISSPGATIWWDRRFRLSLRQKNRLVFGCGYAALWGGRSCRLPFPQPHRPGDFEPLY